MNQEISASYIWNIHELIKSREDHQRAQCRPAFRVGIIFLSTMAIISGFCYYLGEGWSLFTFLFPSIGIYFLFLRKYDVRWSLRRQFKKRPDKDSKVNWTLGDEAIQIKTSDSEFKARWNQITKVRKARNGYLFYPDETMYYWLPKLALTSEDARIKAEDLIVSKVNDYKLVK